MSKWTQPSVCFMRKKKPYLNLMTHWVKRKHCKIKQTYSLTNTAFIKYSSSSYLWHYLPLSSLYVFLSVQVFLARFPIKHLISFTVFVKRPAVWIECLCCFICVFCCLLLCLATITHIILLAWEALPFPCQPCSHTITHTAPPRTHEMTPWLSKQTFTFVYI